MLVVRRKIAESLVIGDDIYIEILDVVNGQVKIGITAPRNIPVARSEIRLTGLHNRQAAGLPAAALDQLVQNFRGKILSNKV